MAGSVGDTIAAVATPPGEGGIAVIRVSGPEACATASRIFRSRAGRRLEEAPPFRLSLGEVRDPSSGERVDEVLAVRMPPGRSYTGEEMVEIHSHGGRAVVAAILRSLLEAGARHAEPGEFTRRAFLGGRMDLSQAEAVAELIRADSEEARRAALHQLEGGLGREIAGLRARLIELLAEVEAVIDFAEEEGLVVELSPARVSGIARDMRDLVTRGEAASAAGNGVKVTIAGRPNSGKSSLFNILSCSERSIVTPLAGTTRDYIEEKATLGGMTVTLVDTAGIRDPRDEAEAEGIRRSFARIEEAAVLVLLLDGTIPAGCDELDLLKLCNRFHPLVVVSKADLPQRLDPETLRSAAGASPVLSVSAHSGFGMAELKRSLAARVRSVLSGRPCSGAAPNERHRDALRRAAAHLETAASLCAPSRGWIDQAASELRSGLKALGEITGESATEDLLERIFSKFCVGK